MPVPSGTDQPLQLLLQLEILADDADDATLALLSAVGRETIDELQKAGSSAQPASTGLRGGNVLIDVVTTLTTVVWANKETIERVITDASGLVTVCGGIVPVAKIVLHAFKKRTATTNNVQGPVKITVEIDGAPVTVEAADLEQAEAALTLAQQFHAQHPVIAAKVTAQSKVKLKASMPKATRRKRR